jgi:hypothetical protein
MRLAEAWAFHVCLALIWGLWRGESGTVLAARLTAVPIIAVALMAVVAEWLGRKDKGSR